MADREVTIPLKTTVVGDVTIVVYHARSTFGGKVQGKVLFLHIICFLFSLLSFNEIVSTKFYCKNIIIRIPLLKFSFA